MDGVTRSRLVPRAGLFEYRGATRSACRARCSLASDEEICLFLKHLWATDGCVWLGGGKSAPKVYYASSSRELADGVAHLLGRLGIVARIRQVEKAGYAHGYHVIVADSPSLRRSAPGSACTEGVGRRLGNWAPCSLGRTANTNVDTVPLACGSWSSPSARGQA